MRLGNMRKPASPVASACMATLLTGTTHIAATTVRHGNVLLLYLPPAHSSGMFPYEIVVSGRRDRQMIVANWTPKGFYAAQIRSCGPIACQRPAFHACSTTNSPKLPSHTSLTGECVPCWCHRCRYVTRMTLQLSLSLTSISAAHEGALKLRL